MRIWGTMNTEQWLLSPNRHLEFFGDVKAGAIPYMKLLEDTVAPIEGMRTWLFSCRYDISNHLAKCLLTREKLREGADPSRAGVLG